jgi:hypothetical protein
MNYTIIEFKLPFSDFITKLSYFIDKYMEKASLLIVLEIIPKHIFKCKKEKLYIPAAFGDGDNRVFLTLKKLRNKYCYCFEYYTANL